MSYKLIFKDAFWQILGRILSALLGFLVIKLISPYLGPLRFGDYSTILKYFAIWSALADFGLYVVALREIGKLKKIDKIIINDNEISEYYSKFVTSRLFNVIIVYGLALIIAYLIPSYSSNPYIIWGLPLGMLFSASFMMAGIIQIPLQIYWKMHHLSIALVLARIGQLLVLGILILYFPNFNGNGINSILIFQIILFSVFISGLFQFIYVFFSGRKYIKLKLIFDFNFTKNHLINNFKYGLAYYLSSFHTLIVLIFLSIFYPTNLGYLFVGLWSVALALIEILLIIPSSLGNSIIHKISNYSLDEKLDSFGNLFIVIIWIGTVFAINFWIFSNHIINFIAGEKYLSTLNSYGSDFILPFLGIVLCLSFIKQIFNYLFVATDLQNKLFKINFYGVVIGVIIGVPLILKYNIIGGVITQILLEVLFVLGAIIIAYLNKILPKIQFKSLLEILLIVIFLGVFLKLFLNISYNYFIIYAIIINILILLFSYNPIKKIFKKL